MVVDGLEVDDEELDEASYIVCLLRWDKRRTGRA